jgi:2-(1,2-epoxy-1,2-dihydrophenyl)acetyl-CoA isomerase
MKHLENRAFSIKNSGAGKCNFFIPFQNCAALLPCYFHKSYIVVAKFQIMQPILSEIKNGVAAITFNRPEKFNSFNREMAFQLQKALDEAASDKNVRCIFITGSGKAFCAGQDLAELVQENAPGFEKILAEHYNPIILRIRNIPKPVLCAVNGVAAGAGANIALACDIVIARESASFIQSFSKIGLIPDCGGTFLLPRLVGFQKASALMMLGDKLSAHDAERLGMIYRVFPDKSFPEEAMLMAEKLARMPTKGLALTKEALNASFANRFEDQLKLENQLQNTAGQSEDYKEGINAFLEKRAPVFTGD